LPGSSTRAPFFFFFLVFNTNATSFQMKQHHQINFADSLNNDLVITHDERDYERGGGASHEYTVRLTDRPQTEAPLSSVATIQFQHGPRDEEGSTPGCTDQVLVAILIDRYESFQAGPYACRENAIVITKLQETLHWMRHRAIERAERGVLGKLEA
jgi:hypothetical protein